MRGMVSRLNAKTHSWQVIPSQFQPITSIDIAGAFGFSNLTDVQSSLLRYKWGRQADQHKTLIRGLYGSVRGIQDSMVWPKYRPNLIWDMCEMAVKEHCILPTCKKCSGQKYLPEVLDSTPTGKMVPCATCLGFGLAARKRQEMVWNLGMSPQAWHRYGWAKLYRCMLETLQKSEYDAFKSLRFG